MNNLLILSPGNENNEKHAQTTIHNKINGRDPIAGIIIYDEKAKNLLKDATILLKKLKIKLNKLAPNSEEFKTKSEEYKSISYKISIAKRNAEILDTSAKKLNESFFALIDFVNEIK
jgi:hypothetical protein